VFCSPSATRGGSFRADALASYIWTGIVCPALRADRVQTLGCPQRSRDGGFRDVSRKRAGRTSGHSGLSGSRLVSAKMTLARKVNRLLIEFDLSQIEAAEILGMPQPKVSAISNYKLQGISVGRLMEALTALGQHVEITVTPCGARIPARIRVAA
jgi:predicted XRE-type DNA-binding protein